MITLKRRLLAKTITYKVLTLMSTTIIIGAATGSIGMASGIALVLLIVNTLIYMGHEAAWNNTQWGRVKTD